ncbi:sensor histidine kinase [Galliscardovia ingluviei]|uniref:histidine kinase n=1 Tax=Galliscardovia ingluviei TaxID=1769422 RepID=A0A8J3AGD0_9BIFI|nr:histidine kinase [Galliscardovia ingluviei]GGI12818.1 sensor histidine kinase [Galliscardovia ingluviei]
MHNIQVPHQQPGRSQRQQRAQQQAQPNQHSHQQPTRNEVLRRLVHHILHIVQSPLVIDSLSIVFITFISTVGAVRTLSPGLIFPYDNDLSADTNFSDPSYWMWWNWILILPVCIRRVRPVQASYAFIALALLQLVFGPALVFSDVYALVLVYTITVRLPKRQLIPLLISAYGMVLLTTVVLTITTAIGPLAVPESTRINTHVYSCLPDHRQFDASGCVHDIVASSVVGIMLAPLLSTVIIVALWHRSRQHTAQLLQEQTATLAANLQQQAQVVRLAERARIARDMHDVVAHTLSIIIVQADAGRLAGAHNLPVALHTMQTIVSQSHQALDGMHELLGTIEEPPEQATQDPQTLSKQNLVQSDTSNQTALPQTLEQSRQHSQYSTTTSSATTYRYIPQLISQAQLASPDCTFTHTIEGTPEPRELSAAASTTAYRVVQESLSNIRKHAGPRVHVDCSERWSVGQLELTIRDDGRGVTQQINQQEQTSGFGLLGMKERVEACGGTLEASPQLQGGFVVHARIPFESAAPTLSSTPLAAQNSENGLSLSESQSLPTLLSSPSMQKQTLQHQNMHSQPTHSSQPHDPLTTSQNAATQSSTDQPHALRKSIAQYCNIFVQSIKSVINTLRQIMRQPRTIDPHKPVIRATQESSIIARFASWTSRHYMVMDAILAIFLITINVYYVSEVSPLTPQWRWVDVIIVIIEIGPLVLRRRMPQLSAALIGSLAIAHCIFLSWWPSSTFVVCISLYSVMLYGPKTAKLWVYPLSAFGCTIAALRYMAFASDLPYGLFSATYTLFTYGKDGASSHYPPLTNILIATVAVALANMLTCTIAIAAGLIRQSRNTNLWVLQAQQQALLASQQQRVTLAANMERNHIASQIQQEVTDTLYAVINQAEHGLTQLETWNADVLSKDSAHQPDYSEQVAQVFTDIATLGRDALARMRALLRVLRDTSDTDSSTTVNHAPLKPIQQ